MKISYSKDFIKSSALLNKAQKIRLKQRIVLYLEKPYSPQLRNHKLAGEWNGYSSINVTGDIRAIFQQTNDEVYFVAVGSHAQLYK